MKIEGVTSEPEPSSLPASASCDATNVTASDVTLHAVDRRGRCLFYSAFIAIARSILRANLDGTSPATSDATNVTASEAAISLTGV